MGITEMKMLRWMCGLTRKDRVRNDKVRGILQVAPIKDKLRKNRLRWFGHVERGGEGHITKAVQKIKVKGRPKLRWLDVLKQDMKKVQAKAEDVLDRDLWKNKTRHADAKDFGQTRR